MGRTFKLLNISAVLLGSVILAHADSIDDYIKAQMRVRQIPGLQLAVARDGKLIKAKSYGVASPVTEGLRSRSSADPVNYPASRSEIASIWLLAPGVAREPKALHDRN